MNKIFAAAFLALALSATVTSTPLLTGCSYFAVKTPETPEEKLTFVQSGVAEVQAGLKEKILTNSISKRSAENIDKQLDSAIEGLDIAISVKDTNPTESANRLEAAKIIVGALKGLVK